MADTEKVTINMSVVDLGKVELLVEEGFYSSRTDLIRTAVRNQLESHKDTVKETVVSKVFVLGVIVYSREELEEIRKNGKQVEIRVVGAVVIEKDVTPELAQATIKKVVVRGVLRASADVKAALSDRIK